MIHYLLIEMRCSPEQISAYLRKFYMGSPELQVSPEAIYLWVYNHEKRYILTRYYRRRHKKRRINGKYNIYRGGIKNKDSIHDRPSKIHDREEIGHWEGNLIIGNKNQSAIGTLVERGSRYTILVKLDSRDSHTVVNKFIQFFQRIPPHLRQSLTCDNGSEITFHEELTRQLHMPVYFADPRSPRQRGSNDNTNGLIREFLPKSTNLSEHSQEHLSGIATLLNRRPRKVLSFNSPEDVFYYCYEKPKLLSHCLKHLK